MMLNRSNDVELDFDFDKVKEKQKIILFFMFNMLMLELILLRSLDINLTNKILLNKEDFNLNELKKKL